MWDSLISEFNFIPSSPTRLMSRDAHSSVDWQGRKTETRKKWIYNFPLLSVILWIERVFTFHSMKVVAPHRVWHQVEMTSQWQIFWAGKPTNHTCNWEVWSRALPRGLTSSIPFEGHHNYTSACCLKISWKKTFDYLFVVPASHSQKPHSQWEEIGQPYWHCTGFSSCCLPTYFPLFSSPGWLNSNWSSSQSPKSVPPASGPTIVGTPKNVLFNKQPSSGTWYLWYTL